MAYLKKNVSLNKWSAVMSTPDAQKIWTGYALCAHRASYADRSGVLVSLMPAPGRYSFWSLLILKGKCQKVFGLFFV